MCLFTYILKSDYCAALELGKFSFCNIYNKLHSDVDKQDQQGDKCGAFELHLALKLCNHQSDGLIGNCGQEGDRGNCHHAVNKEVADHFQNSPHRLRKQNIQEDTPAADAHGGTNGLQILIDLAKGIVDHQIGGREEVHGVHQNQNGEGTVNRCGFEKHDVGKAQNDTWNGERGNRHQMKSIAELRPVSGRHVGVENSQCCANE